MASDELRAWLALLATPGLGRSAIRQLLQRHGSAEAALAASPAARQQAGLGAAEIDRTLAWLAAGPAGTRRIVTLGDAEYPPRLLETADPPLLLYTVGRIELLGAPSIAVVGSRNPTPQGRDNALALAAELGRAGLTIVSGLALGIDAAAHEGGLATAASTIGTGIDIVYPKRHAALYERLAADGLIVSELPLGSPPLAPHFPQRNRIIAGLSLGTLVVEAALQSGSLITARLATEAGREVFAVPGSIHSPLARGCHALIQQGAKLVLDAKDVLDELRLPTPPPRAEPSAAGTVAAAEDPVLEALGFDPQTLDALIARTGIPAATLNARLLDLELEGRVARLPGQQFQRIDRA